MELVRIFKDSNVLVSASLFNGNEFDLVLLAIRNRHNIAISEDILEESFRVVLRKFPDKAPKQRNVIS